MIERSLLYVSRKRIDASADTSAIDDIVAVSRARNAGLNVTGALVATTDHFAQILEGDSQAIEQLMDSIYRDIRHTDVTVVREIAIARRSFADWSMAYSGSSTYVSRQIAPLLDGNAEAMRGRAERLASLMAGFVA
ncbi:MAG: BLUF domain-containing protein [Pseudomonadota bacterium]